ncbi:MAG: MFS transporter [Thiobacillaceae bacterium]
MKARKDPRTSLAPGVRWHEVWAWAMFDFANSGYTTLVITAVFNAYFVSVVAGNAVWATLAWTATISVSYALAMLAGPVLGAYADIHAEKKLLLLITTVGCVGFTAGLALVGPGNIWLAVMLVVVSNFFFSAGENLIAGFLPELAKGRALGKVSGWGWGWGYFGGIASLMCSLAYVSWAQGRGQGASQYVPVTMLITAGLFALASLPTFLLLKERAVPQMNVSFSAAQALRRLVQTLVHIRHYRDLAWFFLCITVYQAGVQVVIALAAIYAEQAMGFTTRETIELILVVNFTAALGAILFGHVQDRIGHRPAIALTLVGWLAMVLLAWTARDRTTFWIAAQLAGLCLGSSQSAGRALVGYLSPAARRAEFFGLWGFAVKLSSIIGPLSYGLVNWLSGGDHRLAMLFTGVFFLGGLALLIPVDVRRGRRHALRSA